MAAEPVIRGESGAVNGTLSDGPPSAAGTDVDGQVDATEDLLLNSPPLSSTLEGFTTREVAPAQAASPGPDTPDGLDQQDNQQEQQKDTAGSEWSIETLYEGPSKCKCCINWVEEYPDDLVETVEARPEVKRKALIVRKRKKHGGRQTGGKPMLLDSIVIQNSSLKRTLGEVLQGYEGITTSLNDLKFYEPFREFFFCWDRLEQVLARQLAEGTDDYLPTKLLYDVLDEELRDTREAVKDLLNNGVITFALLWALFEPGKLLFHNTEKYVGGRFFLVRDTAGYETSDNEKKSLIVPTKRVDWNGKAFGYVHTAIQIPEFRGTRSITEMEVFPAQFHPSLEAAEARCVQRGLRFYNLRGVRYMSHSGEVQCWPESGGSMTAAKVEGRIVLDTEAFFDASSSGGLSLIPFTPDAPETEDDTGKAGLPSDVDTGTLAIPQTTPQPVPELTREQLLICDPYLPGYSLKKNMWCLFMVDDIHDIAWNDDAFPSLVLPPGFKSLLLSFVESQSNHKRVFDDVIEGKGQGMIVLLAGTPGTGKTLTAEALADRLRKPLYSLSAAELGNTARDVQNSLSEVLELAEKWDALLLFDECDVFIQERSTDSLAQNEVVSVFLRLLEYYRGTLFMTTNRVDSIDRAFHSRIHLTLHYPDLDCTAKEQIWRQFVTRTTGPDSLETDLADEAFRSLSRLPLNGRQIKNVTKVATMLAIQEKKPLGLEQIRTVLQATRVAGAEVDI